MPTSKDDNVTEFDFQLLITDIDGTLINGPPEISPKIIEAVRTANQRGLRVTLASGRNSAEVCWFLSRLKIREPYIALGGAYVADPRTGKVIFYDALPRDSVEAILQQARDLNIGILIEYPDEILFEGESSFYKSLELMSSSGIQQIPKGAFKYTLPPGKMVLLGTESDLQAVEATLSPWVTQLECARSLPNFLDITKRDVNKGHALQILAENEGIPLNKIIAVGDGWNDQSMFDVAGYSIAMGDGTEGLKENANLVSPLGVENGFLWALDYILSDESPELKIS